MKMKSVKVMMALCMILVLSIPSISFASENVNVSTEPPVSGNEGITTYGVSKPSEYIDLHSNGALSLQGSATGSNLYLNKGITNVTKVRVEVSNNLNTPMTVVFYRNGLWDTEINRTSVPANSTMYYIISNLDASKEYFLAFHAPSDFSGTIRETN